MVGPFTVSELAERLGGRVEGEDPSGGERRLTGVRGLAEAGPEHLSFLANRRYTRLLRDTRAGAVLVAPEQGGCGGRTVIRVADPYLAFAQVLTLFHPASPKVPGVDPRAFVAADAEVEGATIGAFAWVGPGARVGAGSEVEPFAYVGPGAVVGADCRLMAGVVLCAGCVLGDRVWLNPGAVVGAEGFGFASSAAGHRKIPQVGRARVEDDVEVGANTTIDRAALGETLVRRGAKLDNLVQVGHAAEVGERSLLVAFSGVAGSARLGRGVVLAARAAVLGHIELGDGVHVGVGSAVSDDQAAGARVTGTPAIEHNRWLRASAAFAELPELLRRTRQLEAKVAALEAALVPSPNLSDPEST